MVLTVSSTDLNPIQPTKPTTATTIAYQVRDRGTANGSAATSTTPANSMASRVMLEPIWELISQTMTIARPYTADVIRTVFQSRGTRTTASTA